MITDCFDPHSEPTSTLFDFYGAPGNFTDTCLCVLSDQLAEHLLTAFPCKKVGEIRSCNGIRPIYTLNYKGKTLAFYLSMIGSALATACCEEAAWITGARKFILFGSCGSLDGEATKGKYIIPTQSYRGEGCSYYYAPPADYISIRNSNRLAALFTEMNIPHIQGRIWTTDSFGRETRDLVAQRKKEGCIAVEMEIAGVQACCDFRGYDLFPFLEPGDVIADSGYQAEGLQLANHSLAKLYIALELAIKI